MRIFKALHSSSGFYFEAYNKWWWWISRRQGALEIESLVHARLREIEMMMRPSSPLEFLLLTGKTIEQAVEASSQVIK
jgi:hypothetical protein